MSLVVAGVGVFWTIGAMSVGAPWFFTGFGVMFVVMALCGAGANFYNATSRQRFSTFDVMRHDHEPDPLDDFVADPHRRDPIVPRSSTGRFCPQCGEPAASDFRFCPGCGSELV